MTPVLFENSIIKAAAFLGCIQGLAWTGLSAAAIISHLSNEVPNLSTDTYFDSIKSTLYVFYIYFNDEAFKYQLLRGFIFHIFMWLYLVFDIAWVFASVLVFFYSSRNSSSRLSIWAVLTLCVSLIDFIMVILLGFDYVNCMGYVSSNFDNQLAEQQVCASGVLIPLTIAAKGYTLWFINVILGVYFIKLNQAIKKEQVVQQFTPQTIQQAYPHVMQRPEPIPENDTNFRNYPQNYNQMPPNQYQYSPTPTAQNNSQAYYY